MTVANLEQPTATSTGFNFGSIFENTLNNATNLLSQWGAWEIQNEIMQEAAQTQAIANQVAQGQAAENSVPDDAQNTDSDSFFPDWAPTAMLAVGGLAAFALIWRVLK